MIRKVFVLIFSAATWASAGMPELDLPADLPQARRDLVERSMKALEENPGIPYRFSGESPGEGGMDCSGAVFFLLGKVGIDPPRSSQSQYDWVRESGKLVVVPPTATKPDDAAFSLLEPGDLLFWGTSDGKGDTRIGHVQIYLGKEAKDGRRVMIGASDGRSYRGVKKDGFDIVDFTVPKAESPKKLVGYGPPVWKTRKK